MLAPCNQQPTPWSTVLRQKLTVAQPVKRPSAFTSSITTTCRYTGHTPNTCEVQQQRFPFVELELYLKVPSVWPSVGNGWQRAASDLPSVTIHKSVDKSWLDVHCSGSEISTHNLRNFQLLWQPDELSPVVISAINQSSCADDMRPARHPPLGQRHWRSCFLQTAAVATHHVTTGEGGAFGQSST